MVIKQPRMFSVSGLPRGLFGDAYVIVSVWKPSTTLWTAEYHILTKRPHEHLLSGTVDFDTTDFPPELEPIDDAYMEAEAMRQVEIDIGLELERRATESNRPDWAYLPLRLDTTTITAVTLWTRDMFPTKFGDMAAATKSPQLKRYLQVVMGLHRLKPV